MDSDKSAKAALEPKMQAYLAWLHKNGVLFPKVQFPAYFDGVCGSMAKDDIHPQEAFIFVPNKLLITTELARQSVLQKMFSQHPELFQDCLLQDSNPLIAFLIYERLKGKKGFWHPYFEAVDPGIKACLWHKNVIESIESSDLYISLQNHLWTHKQAKHEFSNVLKKFPCFFKGYTADLYDWASVFVQTRQFGANVPCNLLAPLADSLNHSTESNVAFCLIQTKLHSQRDERYMYETDFQT